MSMYYSLISYTYISYISVVSVSMSTINTMIASTVMIIISYALSITPSNIVISSNASMWAIKINTCTGNMVQITFSAPRNV